MCNSFFVGAIEKMKYILKENGILKVILDAWKFSSRLALQKDEEKNPTKTDPISRTWGKLEKSVEGEKRILRNSRLQPPLRGSFRMGLFLLKIMFFFPFYWLRGRPGAGEAKIVQRHRRERTQGEDREREEVLSFKESHRMLWMETWHWEKFFVIGKFSRALSCKVKC